MADGGSRVEGVEGLGDRDAIDAGGRVAIRARRVRFGWEETPLHWAGDPQTTHTLNVLHLLLPAGERWFVDLYRRVLPDVVDERLRADVRGFVGQEATHARAHAAVLDHLAVQGIDTEPFTRWVDRLFDRLLAGTPLSRRLRPPRPLARRWTRHRLGIVAAIEHCTAALGGWFLAARAYDRPGTAGAAGTPGSAGAVDPAMLDLLRWHAAEEVEHRAVAFDLYVDQGGGYLERLATMLEVVPVLVGFWIAGTVFLLRRDPTRPGRPTLAAFDRAARAGWLPSAGTLARMLPSYLRPSHHPLQMGSTATAVAYLARSPAATAARGSEQDR
jgi:predicted metal-dependent hydrolase